MMTCVTLVRSAHADRLRTLSVVVGALLLPVAAFASIPLTVDSAESSSQVDAQTTSQWSGFLIGDYDAVANPGGTQTRPGFFGGSGNMPVPVDLTPEIDAEIDGIPTGTLSIDPDPGLGTIGLNGLDLDLIGTGSGTADLTVTLLFSTFRTFNPDSLFPGGVPVPVPFGNVPILSATMTQAAPATGTLTPADGSGTLFDVDVLIPVLINFEVDLFGSPAVIGPLAGALPATGQYAISGGDVTLSLAVSLAETIVDNGPFDVGFDAIPVALPTVLPEGDIANVLLTADLQSISSNQQVALTIVATGQAGLIGDLNNDGAVDSADLLLLLSAWGTCPKGPCPADLNGDGVVDSADLLLLFANWTG